MKTFSEELKSIKGKNKPYRPPLPIKPQRCVHHRGRSGKVKIYTEEEIFLYKLRECGRIVKTIK